MPNTQQPSFDHEASLEELAGVGKKSRIDQRLADAHITHCGTQKTSMITLRGF